MSMLEWVCDIIQKELALPAGRVMLWNQKTMMPTDADLWVVVHLLSSKSFGAVRRFNPQTQSEELGVQMFATISIDIMSRSFQAVQRREEVLLALASTYAEKQMNTLGFYISKVGNMVDLSNEDGPAIPYRFNISVNVQYSIKKTKAVDYYDTFPDVAVSVNK